MTLEVTGLSVRYDGPRGTERAVDRVSLRVHPGETVALVGESDCGKTTTALAVVSLLPRNSRVEAGEIRFRGRDLSKLDEGEMRAILGAEIGVVFQDPLAALDPVHTIGDHLREALRGEPGFSKGAETERVLELLAKVGLPDPARIAREHPHRLSGGMRQRAMIAIAIARKPSLLVADEPTSALDTTVQAGILELFRALQAEMGMGILLITHDLAVVAENAERADVMYAGRIVESAPVEALFRRPHHPYTAMLLRSHPSRAAHGRRLQPIPGRVPGPSERPSGCRFRDRCPIAREKCAEVEPQRIPVASPGALAERSVACHFDEEAASL
jgi:oligopeptide/dipeptide ABC transporter ATP-binding protein